MGTACKTRAVLKNSPVALTTARIRVSLLHVYVEPMKHVFKDETAKEKGAPKEWLFNHELVGLKNGDVVDSEIGVLVLAVDLNWIVHVELSRFRIVTLVSGLRLGLWVSGFVVGRDSSPSRRVRARARTRTRARVEWFGLSIFGSCKGLALTR